MALVMPALESLYEHYIWIFKFVLGLPHPMEQLTEDRMHHIRT
jgi:hypothetical protein